MQRCVEPPSSCTVIAAEQRLALLLFSAHCTKTYLFGTKSRKMWCIVLKLVRRAPMQRRNAEAVALYNESLKTAFAYVSEHPEVKSEWAKPLKAIALRTKELKTLLVAAPDLGSTPDPVTPRAFRSHAIECRGAGTAVDVHTFGPWWLRCCAGTKLQRVIDELPDALQTRFADAVAAERAGETSKAAAEYQAGVKLSAGFLKEHPEMKATIAPKLQEIIAHAKQLAAR